MFCLLYSLALTTVSDHWENHSLDYTDLCWQSNISAFQHTVEVYHPFPAKKQSSSDLMAAVTICNDFRAQEEETCHYFHLHPFYLPWSNGADAMILVFLIFSFKLAPSPSKGSLVPLCLLPIRVISSAYLRLLMFLLPILIQACNSSSPAFLMMCSAYRLNKQGTADSPAVPLSQSWTNQLFHTGV